MICPSAWWLLEVPGQGKTGVPRGHEITANMPRFRHPGQAKKIWSGPKRGFSLRSARSWPRPSERGGRDGVRWGLV